VRRIRPFACVLLLTACGDAAPAATAAEPVVRDSASITIVENTAPQWGDGEAWRLSAEPVLEIGMMDGPEEYQLFRVFGSTRLADGGIAVANFGTHQLRFYGPDGRYRRSAGGAGGGPGEFQWMGPPRRLGGDTLLVYDQMQRRFSFFTAEGEFLHAVSLESAGNLMFAGRLDDGTFPMRYGWRSGSVSREARTGIIPDTAAFVLYSREGLPGDTLARLPGGDRFMLVEGSSRLFTAPPFARHTFTTTWGGRFYVGTGQRYEILVYDRPGRPSMLIRHPRPNLEVSPEHIAHFREERLSRSSGSREAERETRRLLDRMPFPEEMPAHGRLVTDAGGNLWVAHYRPDDEGQPQWDVFDPDGRWLGVVETPATFAVHEIGDDYVLGVYRDELDVEYVRKYALIKPGARS